MRQKRRKIKKNKNMVNKQVIEKNGKEIHKMEKFKKSSQNLNSA